MKTTSLWLLLLLLPLAVQGQIYKKVLPDGSVAFSDEPAEGAVQIEPPKAQTFTPPPITAKPPANEAAEPAEPKQKTFKYQSFQILTPRPEQAIRTNAGDVTVEVEVLPGLNNEEDHKLMLLLDGKPVEGPTTDKIFRLENLTRGSHTVAAQIQTPEGSTVRTTDPVTFHVLRHSVLFNR